MESYTLNGLYPNTLYYIWLAARSQRGEGATTPPIAVRTKQYGMLVLPIQYGIIGQLTSVGTKQPTYTLYWYKSTN